jgi:hypothetical protein
MNDYKIVKNKKVKQATLLTKENLKTFDEFLKSHFDSFEFIIKTKDNLSFIFKNFDEFISSSYFKKSEIISIEIQCLNQNNKLYLEFTKFNFLFIPETIRYNFYNNDLEWGYKFIDDLDLELKNLKAWYNIFVYLDFKLLIPTIYLFIILSYLSIDYILKGYLNYNISDIQYNDYNENDLFQFIRFFIIFVTLYTINFIKEYFVPTFFVALGNQEKEIKKRMTIAKWLFGVLGLGVFVNYISNFL